MKSYNLVYNTIMHILSFTCWFYTKPCLLLPGAELSLIAGSFGLLNYPLLPFLSILDASCPIFDLHLADVLFDVILPSVLGSSL